MSDDDDDVDGDDDIDGKRVVAVLTLTTNMG